MRKEIDPEKLRTMIRSILPSKSRATTHAKATENRFVRRKVRLALHTEDEKADPRRDSYHGHTVAWRRGADKLNHFMRWCEALTEGMTTRDALSYVRSILPDSVIGDHAYGHWEVHCRYRRGKRRGYVKWKEEMQRKAQSLHDRIVFALRRALTERPELLGELNAAIKSRKKEDEPRRMLFGIHDVEAFTHHVLTYAGYDAEEQVIHTMILSGRPSGRPRSLAA